ncbi:MAG: PBS lyase, partial [candidate division Zixibacteria bacterium]|nr:PBS lyase [candidate division Zixibacteria bacterium]
LKEEPFERGTHWAIARLAPAVPDHFTEAIPQLRNSLMDTDSHIRGYSLMALKSLGVDIESDMLKQLSDDDGEVRMYDFGSGELKTVKVKELV